MLRDECKLLIVLPLHAMCFSPAFLFTPRPTSTLALLVYVAALATSAVFSASSVCRARCRQLHICILSWLYSSLHGATIVLALFSIRHFLYPFLSTTSFQDNCSLSKSLQTNAAGLSCPDLQAYAATSLVLLTASVALSAFVLVLGHRISKKQSIEYRRVKKEIERHQHNNTTPSSTSSSDESMLIQQHA
ncbi:hypothetical protein DYB25_013837 [Aphanomyces astaci]|uniref:Uncharacterized protein n=1 Tax=Aphanomyces astaci TaxID=112090 RepID=A0A397BPK5_APHAT|nr:hypothetical protein DYB25_013837 [Aphanomyces astaci]RHY20354.1 hypothetical protein DYB36_011053 [Aphanomyces astaci]RHY44283.1 hypothetical protein DYB34_011680 [Aphanomyces astaci]RHY52602.1 hypothetical protein DYB38_005819 [Aphanomyces astaci]RHY67258.1 hypothetical protein DYB30_009063 [Aphanomyces astaci]